MRRIFPQGTRTRLLKDEDQIPQSTTQKWINCFPWSQQAQSHDCKHTAGATFPEFTGILTPLFTQKAVGRAKILI